MRRRGLHSDGFAAPVVAGAATSDEAGRRSAAPAGSAAAVHEARYFGSAKLISAITLASRILGLGRDMLCAYVFGAGEVMAAFTIGFQVPNLFRRLFGEGALSASSIPVLSDRLHHGGREGLDELSGKIMGVLLAVLVAVAVIGEAVTLGFGPMFVSTPRGVLTLGLTALMLPYVIPVCASAILGGIQNIFGQFAVPASNPIVLNVFQIAAMVLAGRLYARGDVRQAYLLGSSVVVSGFFQLAWQWLNTRRCGLRLRLSLDTRDESLRLIARTMIPMTLGLSVVQINALLDSFIAYWFVTSHEGGPAVLGYAQRLYQFPLGVFAIALATALFPVMARQAAQGDRTQLSRTLARGLRQALFEGLPCTVGLILIREPLTQALFERGAFRAGDTFRVAATLATFAAGIWAFGVNQIVVRAFYALKDQMTPLKIAAWMVAGNLALNMILVFRLEEPGIGLATTICAVVQDVLLLRAIAKRLPHLAWGEVLGSAARTAIATALMAAGVLGTACLLRDWSPYAHHSLIRLAVLTGSGAATFLLAAWFTRCRELREVLRRGT
jgi:putative peptidoglycan lipid II flippase